LARAVSLKDYINSIKAQSIEHQKPTVDDLRRAFSDLLLSQRMLNRLGRPSIRAGGLFSMGAPGNGKTSIAERVTKAFGQTIWILSRWDRGPRSSACTIPATTKKCAGDARGAVRSLPHRQALDPHSASDDRGGWRTHDDNLEITLKPSTKISELHCR